MLCLPTLMAQWALTGVAMPIKPAFLGTQPIAMLEKVAGEPIVAGELKAKPIEVKAKSEAEPKMLNEEPAKSEKKRSRSRATKQDGTEAHGGSKAKGTFLLFRQLWRLFLQGGAMWVRACHGVPCMCNYTLHVFQRACLCGRMRQVTRPMHRRTRHQMYGSGDRLRTKVQPASYRGHRLHSSDIGRQCLLRPFWQVHWQVPYHSERA